MAYCGLCGGVLLQFQRLAGTPVPSSRLQWSQEVRAVCTRTGGGITLTGLGYISSSELFASSESTCSYLDPDLDPQKVKRFSLRSTSYVRAFPLHDFCWRVFSSRLKNDARYPYDETIVAWALFTLLDYLPTAHLGLLIPDNGYHGGVHFRKANHVIPLIVAQPSADLSRLQDDGSNTMESSRLTHKSQPSASYDIFSRLPAEVIWNILKFASSDDVTNVRLCSRPIAAISTPELLPQEFWATRFSPDRELGYVFADQYEESVNAPWRQLYRRYTTATRETSGFEGLQNLQNRRCIYRCVRDFALTTEQLMLRSQHTYMAYVQQFSEGPRFACPLFSESTVRNDRLRYGVKPFSKQLISFPPSWSRNGIVISVSFFSCNSHSYISGVRTLAVDNDAKTRAHETIGFTIPHTAETLYMHPTDTILAVEITASTFGIHGLGFYVDRGGHSPCFQSVGAMTCPTGSSGRTVLAGKRPIVGLNVDFDEMKAISIQILEDTNSPCLQHDLSIFKMGGSNCLWNPGPPTERDIIEGPFHDCGGKSSNEKRSTLHSLHLYMDFGGTQGEKLRSLNRVTAFLNGKTGFHGFAFTYDNNEEVTFGTRSAIEDRGRYLLCTEQTFLVDGRAGEFITSFAVHKTKDPTYTRHVVDSIEILTNKGRSVNFQTHGDRFRHLRHPVPWVVDSSDGRLPVAIIASCNPPFDPLDDLKFLKCTEVSPFATPMTSIDSSSTPNADTQVEAQKLAAPWMFAFGGTCFGAGSLKDIRRIRVSSGQPGRCRSSANTSGLWIEYYQGKEDVILGQWMHELGTFELQPGERLERISMWSIQETPSPSGTDRYGKVFEFEFHTSSGDIHEFKLKNSNQMRSKCLEMHWHATPYEELGDILWAFGEDVDEVQIRLHSSCPGVDKCLVFYDIPQRNCARDLSDMTSRVYRQYGEVVEKGKSQIEEEAVLRRFTLRETFFWRERLQNGAWIELLTVRVIFDDDSLVGIQFVYESGVVRALGSIRGKEHDLSLQDGEAIALLMVEEAQEGRISAIKIQTNKGRSLFVSAGFKDPVLSRCLFELDTSYEDTTDQEAKRHDATCTSVFSAPLRDDIGCCTGLWFEAMQDEFELRIQATGPIFLTKEYEKHEKVLGIDPPADAEVSRGKA